MIVIDVWIQDQCGAQPHSQHDCHDSKRDSKDHEGCAGNDDHPRQIEGATENNHGRGDQSSSGADRQ